MDTFFLIILFILFSIIFFFLLRTLVVTLSMFFKVPYVPSTKSFKEAIQYLNIQQGDNVLDIGSGDGRILIYASKIYPNAKFLGIEKNIFLVYYSNILKFLLGRKNLSFKQKDALKYDISNFDAIYMYLLPDFVDMIFSLNPEIKLGCRIVSFHYPLGKSFSDINKVVKYPVKYRGKEEYIFKWVNDGNIKR